MQLNLTAAPSSQKPKFSFGCTKNGTATCTLGTVDSGASHVQLQAQVAVPANATSVTSVKLNVRGIYSPNPAKDVYPQAALPIGVTAPSAKASTSASSSSSAPASAAPGAGTFAQTPASSVGQRLPSSGLPYLNTAGTSSLSPGGNASGLFPTLGPSSGSAAGQPGGPARTKPVANESALPSGAPVIGAQLAGLIALALAFVLAVTRLSIRQRPSAAKPQQQPQPPSDGPK